MGSSLERSQRLAEASDGAHLSQWKPFRSEEEFFALHIPSSIVVELNFQLWHHLEEDTDCFDPECLLKEWGELLLLQAPGKKKVAIDIRAIALNVIEKCNLRCTYCYAGDGSYGSNSVMSLEVAKKAIRLFSEKKPGLHIKFFGGEPLLNFGLIKEVVEWCKTIVDKRFTFELTSNGTLLREEHLRFLQEHRFLLKISYDGKGIQEQQRLDQRGGATLAKLVERKLERFAHELASLRKVMLRSTITKDLLPLLEQALCDALNSQQFQVAFARVASPQRGAQLHQEDIDLIETALTKVVDHYLEQEDYASLLRLTNLRALIMSIHRGETHRNFCGAGVNYLSVATNGKFYLCHRFTEDRDECIGSLEEGLDLHKLQEIRRFRQLKHEPCRSCWMRHFCGGGCFHEHKMATGSALTIEPAFCKLQEVELLQAVRVYLHIMRKAPELFERA